ncbi:MAG: IS21 family transposase [Blastocatellia bacterium]
MISAELIAKIRRLFFAEHWKIGTIAAELGLHPDTVRGAIESHRFNLKRVACARAALTDPYLDFITQTLKQYPRLRATRLYEMLRQRGYTGSQVQLRRVVRSLRPTKHEAFLRLTTLAGEQAQADWAHFGSVRVGRATRKLSCFVITLSYSRALWVEFFFDQSLENLLLGHLHAFQDWGGVPRTILYDNLASVVSERRGDAVHFHPRLLELCAHYHFDARPCRPARGNEKGRVERAIQYLRHSFFAARSFTSPADLNRQALVWRDQIAHQRPWPGDDSRRVIDALTEEQPRLLALPVNAFDTDLVKPLRSDKTIYVRFDANDYSIPPEAVGRPLTLVANPEWVRLLDGAQEIARHRRSYDRHARIEDLTHIAALVEDKRKALGATTGSRLSSAAPRIEEFLDAAFARGEAMSRLSKKLIELLDDYGAAELRAAIDEALERQTPRAASLALILEQRRRRSARKLPPVDLSRHPHLQHLADLSVPTQPLEVYDELTDDDEQ